MVENPKSPACVTKTGDLEEYFRYPSDDIFFFAVAKVPWENPRGLRSVEVTLKWW